MRNLLAILTLPVLTFGCVVYDNDGPGSEPDIDIGRDYDDNDLIEEADLGFTLAFAPVQAEQGESFIGYLTISEGEFNLNDVAGIKCYGDVDVATWDTRSDEVILSVAVPADAVEGEIDIIVEFVDGTAVWIEAALTVYETNSGHSSDDGYDLNDSGSSDDDSGDGSDDSTDDGDCDE